jgi:hypothetical protein
MAPIISSQSGWQWTRSCPELHRGGFRDGGHDGNFWHLGGVTRWNSQFFIHTWTFLAIIFVVSHLFLCLLWISLWACNRCLQCPCFKNLCQIAQASKNWDSNVQHFLLDFLTHSWFHSMLFALLGYQFPYTVMNKCLYLNFKFLYDPGQVLVPTNRYVQVLYICAHMHWIYLVINVAYGLIPKSLIF